MEHDLASLIAAAPHARLYLRPVGFVDGPLEDPTAAKRLAGGACWFSAVQVIARKGERRVASVVVPVSAIDGVLADLPEGAHRQWQALLSPRAPLVCGPRTLRFDRPQLMGIVNVTPDSFSDGGQSLDPGVAADAVHAQAAHGAAVVDIGAESTRPGSKPVWEGDEIARMQPVLERLRHAGILISADTRKASVMRMALDHGAGLINDVSALTWDPASLPLVAQAGCPVVLMHAQGTPETMQAAPAYADPLLDVFDWLAARIEACVAGGIARSAILLDPGIGFGKTVAHNLAMLNGLALFHALGCPLLLGVSRKRFIGALSREEPPTERLGGSLAAMIAGAGQGAQLLRVHDVAASAQALKVWQGCRDAAVSLPAG